MNFLTALFGSKAPATKLQNINNVNNTNNVNQKPSQIQEIEIINPIGTNTYENLQATEEINTEDFIRNIFTDKCTKPEKNNCMYVSEIMSMPNIAEIVNKTYSVSPNLDEESKKIHEHLRSSKLYKITNPLESHNHYFYKTGVNKFQGEYTHKVDCAYGGLYFGKDKDILRWLEWGIYVREVFLCPDSKIVGQDGLKYKTDKFILGARKMLSREFLNSLMPYKYTDQTSGGILGFLIGQQPSQNNPDAPPPTKEEHEMSQTFVKMNELFNGEIPPTKDQVQTFYRCFNEKKRPMFVILSSDGKWKDVVHTHLLNMYDCSQYYEYSSDIRYRPEVYHLFKYMDQPSEDVKRLAISLNPMCIEKIYKPSLELCRLAIDRYPKFMSNLMDQQICDELVTQLQTQGMFYNLHYIKNINEFHQEYLVSRSPLFLMLLVNPTQKVLEICEQDPTTQMYVNMYNKSCSNYLRDDVNLEMQTRLIASLTQYFDTNTQKFLDQLVAYGGYISGSFACNAFYGTNYNCSDIDIYFNNYACAINFGEALKTYEYLRTGCVKYDQYSILGAHIDRIITHKVIGPRQDLMPKIQLIVINRNVNPVNYIMTYFDINHCKVAIDGNCSFYSYDQKLISNDSESIQMTNVSNHIINVFNLFQKSVEFYKESGSDEKHKYFRSLLMSMRAYIKKVHERIDKYKGRGVVFNEENIILFDSLVDSVKSHIVVNIDTAENTLNFDQNSQVNLNQTTQLNNEHISGLVSLGNTFNDSINNDNDSDIDDVDGIDRLVFDNTTDLLDLSEYENINKISYSQMGTVGVLLDDMPIINNNIYQPNDSQLTIPNNVINDNNKYVPEYNSSNINFVSVLNDVFSYEEPKQKID